MGLINLKDIVTLASAGYKPSEIKELIALSTQSEEPAKEGEKKEQPEKTEEHDAGREQPEEAPNNGTVTPEDESVISYKKKIEELEAQIQKLQSENVHKDLSDVEQTKSDEDLLNEITESYM